MLDADLNLVKLGVNYDASAHAKYDKWKGYVRQYATQMAQLSMRYNRRAGDGAGPDGWEAGDSKEQARRWGDEYKALIVQYREILLDGYTPAARGLHSLLAEGDEIKRLLTECLMLVKAVYDRCEQRANRGGLGFAWNVCGDYLCHIKVMARCHASKTSRPAKAVSESHLCLALSSHSRRAASAEGGGEEGGAEGGAERTVEELSSGC